jgi:hypothetical protein
MRGRALRRDTGQVSSPAEIRASSVRRPDAAASVLTLFPEFRMRASEGGASGDDRIVTDARGVP